MRAVWIACVVWMVAAGPAAVAAQTSDPRALLSQSPYPAIRAHAAELIGREQRIADVPQLARCARSDVAAVVRAACVSGLVFWVSDHRAMYAVDAAQRDPARSVREAARRVLTAWERHRRPEGCVRTLLSDEGPLYDCPEGLSAGNP